MTSALILAAALALSPAAAPAPEAAAAEATAAPPPAPVPAPPDPEARRDQALIDRLDRMTRRAEALAAWRAALEQLAADQASADV